MLRYTYAYSLMKTVVPQGEWPFRKWLHPGVGPGPVLCGVAGNRTPVLHN